jgi:hypothetical protein
MKSNIVNIRTLLLLATVLFGAWLRLDQFAYQVVTDDEWHALNQLISHTPRQFLLTYGFSDFSIPLALLYWTEANGFGLSELGMRWPMMSAGLLMLVLFPVWVSRHLGWRVALLFALLLAISPLLVNYSRNARPYALTLLLGFLAHHAFLRYEARRQGQRFFGFLYGASATLASWLHLISLPFVAAPIILATLPALKSLRQGDRIPILRLLVIGIPTGLATALLTIPPLLSDPGAMLNKSGSDHPTLKTLIGVWYTWLGTPSTFAVLVCIALALLGITRIWKTIPIAKSVTLGLLLILMLLLASGPAWIHNPLTFGRYLLPAMVVLLLAVAVGTDTLASRVERAWGTWAAIPVLLLPAIVLIPDSPLKDSLRRTNSNTLHSYFQFDYRKNQPGSVKEKMESRIPLSPWWATLADKPRESLLIAAAPFYNFSPKWDAPRWEKLGRQRVIPGYLTGLCVDRREGELPEDGRFTMRNSVYLGDERDLALKRISLIAFQKPYLDRHGKEPVVIGADVAHCLDVLRTRFGNPDYEDDKIAVFSLLHPNSTAAHDQ